ncbi:MAG TPA: hypothetical protein VJJ20_03450 [Candidatus Paceibacterota bacterium]
MSKKQLPFVDFPRGKEMDSPPPDGLYATISHNPGFRGRHALVPNALPWRTTVYEFKDGMCDERGMGSDAGGILNQYDVAKVFLIGLDATERAELDKNLAKHGIELVEALSQEEALKILKSLRPVSGTDPDFDYKQGQAKS